MAANINGLVTVVHYDLIVVLDDANNEIYYAQLVEEKSTLHGNGCVAHP